MNWTRSILFPLRIVKWTAAFLARFLPLAWATLAVYFSNLPWPWLRTTLAVALLVFGIWSLWFAAKPRAKWAFVGVFVVVLGWWLTIRPSLNRDWRPEVAVMPRAEVEGDHVRLSGYRNFDYRTTEDFTVRYEDREVSLEHLTGMDLFVSYWRTGPVAHTFVSFNFDNALPVCISIEVRPVRGQDFGTISTLFKQYQLIYVVGDERDLVRVRTNYRHEEVYRYRIVASPESCRKLFQVYLDRINQLADKPEFYHLFRNSCTVNIVRYANMAGRAGEWDVRHLLNGYMDRYLYRAGLVETNAPFREVRNAAHINEIAKAADQAPDFSARIRMRPATSTSP